MIFNLLLAIFGVLLTIFIVVGVHEGAHFLMARLLSIKVLRCSIGFGKALYTWHDKSGTEYVLAPIPLGGYVKLLDESEGPVVEAEKHLAFNRQPLYKRALVVAAGPFSNLIAAFFLYWIIFMVGFETTIPVIGKVEPHSIAERAELKLPQEIISIDGHPTRNWSSVIMRLIVHIGDQDTLSLGTRDFNSERQGDIKLTRLDLSHWEMNDLKPDPLSSLGIIPLMPEIPLVIGVISKDSPAENSKLRVGDRILKIDNQTIHSWEELIRFIDQNPDKTVIIQVNRERQTLSLKVTLGFQRNFLFQKHGFLGVSPLVTMPAHLMQTIQYPFWSAAGEAFQETVQLSYLNLLLFGKLLTNKLSLYSLGGPITIFQTAGSAFLYGVLAYLGFLAFLNVALGIINFFPIPGLDGGHLLFQLIELITQRPLSLRVQLFCYRLGFIFLIFILIQAVANDLLRIWG